VFDGHWALTTAVTPDKEMSKSEVNTRVRELEVEVSLPGRVLPEALISEAEVAVGPLSTLK